MCVTACMTCWVPCSQNVRGRANAVLHAPPHSCRRRLSGGQSRLKEQSPRRKNRAHHCACVRYCVLCLPTVRATGHRADAARDAFPVSVEATPTPLSVREGRDEIHAWTKSGTAK